MTSPFYLTDESQFVATFGPSHNSGGYTYGGVLPNRDDRTIATSSSTFNPKLHYRGRSGQSLTPPRTRIEHNVRNAGRPHHHHHQQQQVSLHPYVQQSAPTTNQNSVPSNYSYFDTICASSSQSSDGKEHPQTLMAPPRSVASATHSSNGTPEASCSFQMPWQTLVPSSQPASPPRRKDIVTKVTAAAKPFEHMIPPTGYLYDELLKDPAYQHALRAGLLWQSLTSQHVHFPALWYDGDEPARPPMGCIKKVLSKKHHSKWIYYGRHRVVNQPRLNRLIGNRGSSGRLLLHLMVVGQDSGSVVTDICVGCFHPNARGVRLTLTYDPTLETCRDVWIGIRQRTGHGAGFSKAQTIEALLQHYNKGFVESTPLGGAGSKQQDRLKIDNANLKAVFGARPPLFTRFVPEDELYQILSENVRPNVPASIVLMGHYLQDEEM
jgi:hypothetical protein